jgi:hypothetical protein
MPWSTALRIMCIRGSPILSTRALSSSVSSPEATNAIGFRPFGQVADQPGHLLERGADRHHPQRRGHLLQLAHDLAGVDGAASAEADHQVAAFPARQSHALADPFERGSAVTGKGTYDRPASISAGQPVTSSARVPISRAADATAAASSSPAHPSG